MEDGDAGSVGLHRPSKQLNITMGASLEISMRFPSLKIQNSAISSGLATDRHKY